jgi:hypothetical protein
MKLAWALVALAVAYPVAACQCTGRLQLNDALRRSDIVVLGRVAEVRAVERLAIGKHELDSPVVTRLLVTAAWKGDVRELQIPGSFSDCDFRGFEPGAEYLVFAETDIAGLGTKRGYAWASRCLPTQRRDQLTAAELSALGSPLFRTGSVASQPRADVAITRRWKVIGGSALALILALVLAASRRLRRART